MEQSLSKYVKSTFLHVFCPFNASHDFVLISDAGSTRESLVKTTPEVGVAKWVVSSKIEKLCPVSSNIPFFTRRIEKANGGNTFIN